jgi:serine/threonine-protein kinase
LPAVGATVIQDGRFRLLATLGRGGMGTVYRAYDRAARRLVALKVPHERGRPGPSHPLATEYARWSRLDHPNIVRVHELAYAEHGPIAAGTPYLVLEHVPGGTALRQVAAGAEGEATALQLVEAMLSALAHLHACGYVHRDLKPANVLVDATTEGRPRCKLTDFGLAAPIGSSSRPGAISGSLPYVAPEALCGAPLDGRTDLYGLGILLYRLLTGRMPVQDPTPQALLRWHLAGPLPDPALERPDLSPRLRRFVRRLLQRDRTRRPASAARALELLGRPRPEARARTLSPAAHGTRARLRLALDAARLGARRTVRLPADRETAELLTRELRVWCQVREIPFFRCHDGRIEAKPAAGGLLVVLSA